MSNHPLFSSFLRAVKKQLRARSCQLYRVSPQGLGVEASFGRSRPVEREERLPLQVVESGRFQIALENGRSVALGLPVRWEGAIVGVLVARSIPLQSIDSIAHVVARFQI